MPDCHNKLSGIFASSRARPLVCVDQHQRCLHAGSIPNALHVTGPSVIYTINFRNIATVNWEISIKRGLWAWHRRRNVSEFQQMRLCFYVSYSLLWTELWARTRYYVWGLFSNIIIWLFLGVFEHIINQIIFRIFLSNIIIIYQLIASLEIRALAGSSFICAMI